MNFTHKIDGQDVSIRRLKVSELAVLHELADTWNADAAGFVKGSLGNLWMYANSISGSMSILQKAGVPDAQIDTMERYDMAACALKSCGFKIPEMDAGDGRDGAPSRPTQGGTTNGIG